MTKLNRLHLALTMAVPLTLTLTACSSEPPALEFGSAGPSGARLKARPAQGEFAFGLPSEYESKRNSSIKVTFTAIADPALVQ